MTPPIQLLVGERDLTDAYSDLSFSNSDPGGYEQLSATLSDTAGVHEGDTVTVRCGLDTAWHGRVNESGPRDNDGRTITQIAALGHGAKLTDKRMSFIYADRDLSHWKGAALGRNATLVAGSFTQAAAPNVMTDENGGPVLSLQHADQWANPVKPISEAMYDAGADNTIGAIYFDPANVGAADGLTSAWELFVRTSATDDFASVNADSGDLWGAVLPSGYLVDPSPVRYGFVSFYFTNTPGGAAGLVYSVQFRHLVVYGNVDLIRPGVEPRGLWPGDIAQHALTDSGAGFAMVADDSSGLTVTHSVYRDPVPHQQIIADQATLMGWHYGVWEPQTILDDTPRLFFTAPPPAPTCVIARHDIGDLDAPRVRVDRLYDTAKVKWIDPAGTAGVQTVTIDNPLAAGAGVAGRTLDIDMGRGDSTSAAAYGTFALRLALASARGGGSGSVADSVTLPGGGRKPACLLKSGRDRLRILDLPDSGSITEADANRQDSFLVRRVETTVKGGQPTTRVEFDGGADLLEVLTARLAMSEFG